MKTHFRTRAPLGYSAERASWGRGNILPPPPPPNSQTDGRSGAVSRQSKALDECFLKKLKNIKGLMSSQGHVKGQNRHFSPYRLLKRD